MKTHKSYIQVQENFIKREIFVLNLLKFFFDNKRECCGKMTENFSLIFGEDVQKAFGYKNTHPDYICEFLEELGYAIEYGYKDYKTNKQYYVKLESNGIFSAFVLTTNRKKRVSIDKAVEYSDFSNFEGF